MDGMMMQAASKFQRIDQSSWIRLGMSTYRVEEANKLSDHISLTPISKLSEHILLIPIWKLSVVL
jgi:hypothetical protein